MFSILCESELIIKGLYSLFGITKLGTVSLKSVSFASIPCKQIYEFDVCGKLKHWNSILILNSETWGMMLEYLNEARQLNQATFREVQLEHHSTNL